MWDNHPAGNLNLHGASSKQCWGGTGTSGSHSLTAVEKPGHLQLELNGVHVSDEQEAKDKTGGTERK